MIYGGSNDGVEHVPLRVQVAAASTPAAGIDADGDDCTSSAAATAGRSSPYHLKSRSAGAGGGTDAASQLPPTQMDGMRGGPEGV
jgi:hypothetical protein